MALAESFDNGRGEAQLLMLTPTLAHAYVTEPTLAGMQEIDTG